MFRSGHHLFTLRLENSLFFNIANTLKNNGKNLKGVFVIASTALEKNRYLERKWGYKWLFEGVHAL